MFQIIMNNIKYIDNLQIIDIGNKKICKKKIKTDIISKYNYLKSKDFHNYIYTIIENGYEIRDYIEEVDITKEDKLRELIYVISMLHNKTTHYKNYSLNEIKTFYENTTDEIIEIKKYYNDIVENNDIYLFLKPSINYLIKKISTILIALDNSKYFLDKWYLITKEKLRKRVVMNHNNLKMSNFIVGVNSYLINYDNSIIDYPVYDLVSLFKSNYKDIDMYDLFNEYLCKYSLFSEEKFLLYSLLLKIEKVKFKENEIINTRNITNIINYIDCVSFFLENCMKSKK